MTLRKNLTSIRTRIGIVFLTFILLAQTLFVPKAYAETFDQNAYYQEIGQKLEYWANKYNIPPAVLKAIAWQESKWYQYQRDSSGRPLTDKPLLSANGMGIGIMQVTTYAPTDTEKIERLKTDIDYNIEMGVQLLNEKYRAYPKLGNADRNVLENWYFAIWGYNGWMTKNNPNNPDGKQDNVYQNEVLRLIGQKYNSAITFVSPVTFPAKEALPAVNPPALDSLWATSLPSHRGDLKTSIQSLLSTGGSKGEASGDYWLSMDRSNSALGSYYAYGFYSTAYNLASEAEKQTVVPKLVKAQEQLLNVADQIMANSASSDSQKNIAAKYYWTVLQGPAVDSQLTARAMAAQSQARVERLYGLRAEDTAIKISQEGWADNSTEHLVLARVDQFQDALASAPLAKKLQAPLLLTSPTALDAEVLKEIKRLGVRKVYMIGGPGAIKNEVAQTLTNAGIEVKRIYGETAPDTAVAIARELGPSTRVVIASSTSFADALSASAPAAAQGIPILLTNKESLPQSTKELLDEFGVTKTYLVGGSSVISSKLDTGSGPLVSYGPIRLWGNTQYDTMLKVVKYFNQDPKTIVFATGEGFPDGLAGGAFAALTTSPLFLVGKNTVDENTLQELTYKREANSKVYILGGPGAISSNVEMLLANTFLPQ
jgi:putative cell wall-binding protein